MIATLIHRPGGPARPARRLVGGAGLLACALVATPAAAQDNGFNAHGFDLVPNDGDLKDPVATWRPEAQVKNSFAFVALAEYARTPLMEYTADENGEWQGQELLDHLFGLDLGAAYAPHERVGISLSMPVWFTSMSRGAAQGASIGDVRLSVPVGILLGKQNEEGFPDRTGFTMSVVPWIQAPSGTAKKYVGEGAFTGGGLLAVGVSGRIWQLSLNGGIEVLPKRSYLNLQGGPRVVAGGVFAIEAAKFLSFGVEASLRKSFKDGPKTGEFAWTESPAELMGWTRLRANNGISGILGGGAGITRGVGASEFRLFAGLGWTFGKNRIEPADETDLCPDQPETFNGYKDEDGCPDDLASLVIEVRDDENRDMEGAHVWVGSTELATDPFGEAAMEDLMPGTSPRLRVSYPGYVPQQIEDLTLQEGPNYYLVTLVPESSTLVIEAYDKATGEPINALVRFIESPDDTRPVKLGPDGTEEIGLVPGDFRLLVSAPEYRIEERSVGLRPGQEKTLRIPMEPALVDAQDCQDEIIIKERVEFDFDKDTIRRTSYPLLQEVARNILNCVEVKLVEVQGHTDFMGTDAYNQDLSERRANAVREFLIGVGVEPHRLIARGYGESVPIDTATTDEARQTNRRVQFIILEVEGGPLPDQSSLPGVPDGTLPEGQTSMPATEPEVLPEPEPYEPEPYQVDPLDAEMQRMLDALESEDPPPPDLELQPRDR